jgi:CheY-like chemotaxis protein
MSTNREPAGRHGTRADRYTDLMAHRVRTILMVASRYDSFLLEEEGQLAELLAGEYRNLGLSVRDVPRLVAAESAGQALELAAAAPFDLVVSTTRLPDLSLGAFAERLEATHPALRLGVLVPHAWDIPRLAGVRESGAVDHFFLWQGDAKTLLAMIEQEEDLRNAAHDVLQGGVQVLIVVEDDFRFLSFFLPHLYAEITRQTSRLMAEGLNVSDRLLRLQARPKILLARSWEQAWKLWRSYHEHVLAVIADVGFPRGGALDPRAGLDLARQMVAEVPDLPVLLQSSEPDLGADALGAGAAFVHKGAADWPGRLKDFLLQRCGFGDFIFRLADGTEVGRAATLRQILEQLGRVPEASLAHHASRNQFSRWFAARTEFELAGMVRPRKVSEFGSVAGLRQYLVREVAGYLREIQRHAVADFDDRRFDEFVAFAKIGEGPLGGKGRGLAFVQRLLAEEQHALEGVEIAVPQTVVVAADIFDAYLEENELRPLLARAGKLDDGDLLDAFRRGRFNPQMRAHLAAYLREVRDPIAVRSSSVLEDSPYQPFAGVYATIFLPNNHPSLDVRLAQLLEAIKVVYASTFMKAAREYLETTPHRIEEERMGVLLQRLVGSRHGDRFYPLFSGVASSYNFYPFSAMQPEDGVALVACGLGKTVVEGFEALRFCPAHPQVLPQFSAVKDVLRNAQRRFWALDMTSMDVIPGLRFDANLVRIDVTEALERPDAGWLASTYQRENDALADGIARGGTPLVTFARLLRGRALPLPQLLVRVLQMAQAGMGIPVEIEFAAEPAEPGGTPVFYVLQVRPMVVEQDVQTPELDRLPPERLVVRSPCALGHGRTEGIYDVVVVDHGLDRSRTSEAATVLEKLNAALRTARRPYLLIGPGRWGSRDPWLGIPVAWSQIAGAAAIVETDFDDLDAEPSQGSHFFHNLTSFAIPFLPVHRRFDGGRIHWQWLAEQPAEAVALDGKVRHLRLAAPLHVLLDGSRRHGVVLAGGGEG